MPFAPHVTLACVLLIRRKWWGGVAKRYSIAVSAGRLSTGAEGAVT